MGQESGLLSLTLNLTQPKLACGHVHGGILFYCLMMSEGLAQGGKYQPWASGPEFYKKGY